MKRAQIHDLMRVSGTGPTDLVSVASRPRSSYLLGQGVKVYQQELAQTMHLVGQFLRCLAFRVHGFVAIKPQLVRPALQLRRDSILGGQFVDALFQLPGFDVGRKFLEGDFHRTPVHPTRGIPQLCASGFLCLRKGRGHVIRKILWHIDRLSLWIQADQKKLSLLPVQQVAVVLLWSLGRFDGKKYRAYGVLASPTRGQSDEFIGRNRMRPNDLERSVFRSAMRAIENKNSHE